MDKQYSRWQKDIIEESRKTRRVLVLAGARQCGKTTLCKMISQKEDIIYRTLDDSVLLNAAKNDLQAFISHNAEMLIIDEIQREPLLLLAIKKQVDENNRNGQYLITGSSNIQAIPSVQESLAGRIAKITLRPLTQGEILEVQPDFIERAFEQSFVSPNKIFQRDEIINIALRGGFPEAVKLNEKNRQVWHKDYLAALLERDLKDIANIRRKDVMKNLVSILALWSSKFMNMNTINSKLAIKRETFVSYVNALENLYLVEKLSPWTKTDYDRVGKREKFFFTDSGFMASLLAWNIDKIAFDTDKLGKLVETFIFNELNAQIENKQGKYEIFHYRDREQREIDFIIERDDLSLLGIEVKASSTVDKKDFKHLEWFSKNISKKQDFVGIVLYAGEHTLQFGKNMWAVSMSNLWEEA